MPKVSIKVRPSGLINGREWPEVGEVMDLPAVVVDDMAAAGYVEAVKVPEKSEKIEKRPAPTEAVEKRGTRGRRNSR